MKTKDKKRLVTLKEYYLNMPVKQKNIVKEMAEIKSRNKIPLNAREAKLLNDDSILPLNKMKTVDSKDKAAKLAKLEAELRCLIKITFEDKGQDFTTWVVNREGFIVSCTPCQEWLWKSFKVTNFFTLHKGGKVEIENKDGAKSQIQYAIVKMEYIDMPKDFISLVMKKHPYAACDFFKAKGIFFAYDGKKDLGNGLNKNAAWQHAYLNVIKKGK